MRRSGAEQAREQALNIAKHDDPTDPAPTAWGPEVELFFEDFRDGQHFELGAKRISEEEMLTFARLYDPQPFHADLRTAEGTVFKGLIASGWQTASIWMRLYCDRVLLRAASLGSPGVEDIRWLAPVRAGDLLQGSIDVTSVRASAHHPERGTVVIRGELRTGPGELKMRLTAWGLIARRPELLPSK